VQTREPEMVCSGTGAVSPGCGRGPNRGAFECAKEVIRAKIDKNEAAVVALAVTTSSRLGPHISRYKRRLQQRSLAMMPPRSPIVRLS
jgi:hypothetical protein